MSQEPTSRWEKARLEIARQHLQGGDSLRRAVERAERISASTLEVARVGVWLLSPDHRMLLTQGAHVRATGLVAPAMSLDLAHYPSYAEALVSRRVIRAEDALTDPRTRELADDYLNPLGITALLDAPIFRGGEVIGVVCHEHCAGPRAWGHEDVDFAVSVADMLGALYEQAERLATQERAARVERMEALGRLATGVAHDLTNVLTAVSLNANVVLLSTAEQLDQAHQGAREILAQCELGAGMARRLLRFARAQPGAPTALDVAEVVRALAGLLAPLVSERSSLSVAVDDGDHLVLADRTELEQAVMNLVLNARDAAAPGRRGQIGLRVSAVDGGQGPGRVRITVSDDGVGMDATTCERAFEPFFTTKPGQGTGMGLATVYGAVTQAGGTVVIDSAPGQGTTVTIELPRLAEAPAGSGPGA